MARAGVSELRGQALHWQAGDHMSAVDKKKLELRVLENCNSDSADATGPTATAGVKPGWVKHRRKSQTGRRKTLPTSAPCGQNPSWSQLAKQKRVWQAPPPQLQKGGFGDERQYLITCPLRDKVL